MHTHTRSMWPPSLVWLLPLCRVKKTPRQPFIPGSVSHFPILLFTHSFSLSLILLPSLSQSVFCSRPYFQQAWLAAALWRLPSGGPFVGTAFGRIKKGASTPPSPLFLPPSTLLLLSVLGLTVLKGMELEGAKERGENSQGWKCLDKRPCSVSGSVLSSPVCQTSASSVHPFSSCSVTVSSPDIVRWWQNGNCLHSLGWSVVAG